MEEKIEHSEYFTIEGKEQETVQIYFYKEIGYENFDKEKICAETFCQQLDDIPKERKVILRMNSCGGSFPDGLAIAHKILERGNVVCHIDGLCASAASVVAAACDWVVASEGASLLIHNTRGSVINRESKDIRNLADAMDDVSDRMADIYVRKTGKTFEEIKSLMDKGERLTAKQALDLGLVDEIKQLIPPRFKPDRIETCHKETKEQMNKEDKNPEMTAVQPDPKENDTAELLARASAAEAKIKEMEAKEKEAEAKAAAELLARANDAEAKMKQMEQKAQEAEEKMKAMRHEQIAALVNSA